MHRLISTKTTIKESALFIFNTTTYLVEGKFSVLYSHNQLYIHIYIQKHIQHNKDERTQFFRKIYLSLYWKGCVWEVVGDWTELQHIDRHSYGHNSVSFQFSWAAQLGAWGSSLSRTWSSFQHLLSNCNWGPPLLGVGSLYSILSPTDSIFFQKCKPHIVWNLFIAKIISITQKYLFWGYSK